MGGVELTGKSCPRRPRFVANDPILVAGRDHPNTDRSGNGHPGQYALVSVKWSQDNVSVLRSVYGTGGVRREAQHPGALW